MRNVIITVVCCALGPAPPLAGNLPAAASAPFLLAPDPLGGQRRS